MKRELIYMKCQENGDHIFPKGCIVVNAKKGDIIKIIHKSGNIFTRIIEWMVRKERLKKIKEE